MSKKTSGKWFELIRRGSYQAASEDFVLAYEPVSDLCSDIEPGSDYSVDVLSYEVSKYW